MENYQLNCCYWLYHLSQLLCFTQLHCTSSNHYLLHCLFKNKKKWTFINMCIFSYHCLSFYDILPRLKVNDIFRSMGYKQPTRCTFSRSTLLPWGNIRNGVKKLIKREKTNIIRLNNRIIIKFKWKYEP